MKKHVISYSESNQNSQIGRGSVLLIKGKAEQEGRNLYVTTITGQVEIRPGIKMVFLGDQIYRVVYREERFFGKKVDITSEEGLKGILSLKNQGVPSIVLNHNKTPYHWITTGFTDIGDALRNLGPKLFSHDIILESSNSEIPPVIDRVLIEAMKTILKKEPTDVEVEVVDIKMEYESLDHSFEDGEIPEKSGNYGWMWDLYLNVKVKDGSGLKDELVNQGIIIDILDPVTADFLDISNDFEIKIGFDTRATWEVSRSFSEGYGEEMTDIRNLVESIQVGKYLFIDVSNGIDRMSDKAAEIVNEFEDKVYYLRSLSDFWELTD